MKNKQIHLRNASFFALAFVILGYTVKFFQTSLAGFDSTIQTAIRGNLPNGVTQFWTSITILGNTVIILAITLLVAAFFYFYKKWKIEAYFLLASFAAIGVASTALKYVYQRPLVFISILVAISRIYIGVHYPTDIIGGWLLAITLLQAMYPFYDQKRFEWRFQSKQK